MITPNGSRTPVAGFASPAVGGVYERNRRTWARNGEVVEVEQSPGVRQVQNVNRNRQQYGETNGFTLIEVLVVYAIIALLMALLLPSLSHSRQRAKRTYCLSRLKDTGRAMATYAENHADHLPPTMVNWHPTIARTLEEQDIDPCDPPVMYGWAELLYEEMHPGEDIKDWSQFPVQRNFEGRANGTFNCPRALEATNHAGHFRIYLPGWAREILAFDDDGRVGGFEKPARAFSPLISRLASGLVILGDSNEYSARGDYRGGTIGPGCVHDPRPSADTSDIGLWCGAGYRYNEANTKVVCENDGTSSANCFSDRHSGGANYLLGDLHAEYSRKMRERLGCDWDMNGVHDAYTSNQRELSGCPRPLPE